MDHFILRGESKSFPHQTSITQYFTEGFRSGRIRPDNLALVDGDKNHTFQQLEDSSTKISQVILKCVREFSGNGRDESGRKIKNLNPDGDFVIGVCIQPSDRLIEILFGILKSGAAYVPFDITFPEKRIVKIIKECRPLLVMCDGRSNVLDKFRSVKKYTNVLSVEEIYEKIMIRPDFGGGSESFVKEKANDNPGEQTAIILYTSGSSGEPKGVRISHRAIMNRLSWQWKQFPFIPREKCVFKTALTFVDSVAEIFGPLLQGFQLIVFDKTLASQPNIFIQKLHAYEITRLVLVPSLLRAILHTISLIGDAEGRKLLKSVRLWICSGEALSYDLLEEFFKKLPEKFTLCNYYGSTEVMGDVTFLSFSSMNEVHSKTLEKKVPIGKPLCNTSIILLTDQLQPIEKGSTGEIFVCGSNLATGYVGIPNSDKFLDGIKSTGCGKMYRTGDFGRFATLPNGDNVLMYEGRTDSQIKVRGQRVDLSEIEAIISGFDGIEKVKVLCYHPGQFDQAIVAYVVPNLLATIDQLKAEVEKSLRECERPILRLVEEIPLLVNGKTDKQRLLKMFEAEMENREEFDDWDLLKIPADKMEMAKCLLAVISSVTGTSIQSIAENFDHSFFNIGGNSLNTVLVIVKLREENYYITIPEFTAAQSIREIFMMISTVDDSPQNVCRAIPDMSLFRHGQEFIISILNEKDKSEAIHIISYSFSRKGDLESYVGSTYDDFAKLIESIWDAIVEARLSFIVRRASSGKAIAVSFSFDLYDEPTEMECSKGIKYVMDILEYVESEQRNLLPKGKGQLLHSFMMGTAEEIDDPESVSLIELMEEQNIVLAKKNQFSGIFTTNTNPLTHQIGRDLHGYETLCEYQVNKFVASDGVKPFAVAPDAFKIICCWKQIVQE